MEECSICCCVFTKTKRKKNECKECSFYFCSECLKNDYQVKKTTKEELKCFGCKIPFTRKFLKEIFSKSFFQKEILNHLTENSFSKELDDLQKAQSLATYDIAKINWKKILEEQYEEQRKIKKIVELLFLTKPVPPDFVEELVEIKKKCPSEECRGFLDKNHTCESCNNIFCNFCEEEITDGHVCDTDLLLTLEEKKRDSKPCPKCEIPISKINGCNQMWCPMCNTVFDYLTGNIENGYIHNPEYLAHLRGEGNFIQRARGDVRFCDDLDTHPSWLFSKHWFFTNFGLENTFINLNENKSLKDLYIKEVLEKITFIKKSISDIQYFTNKNKTSEDLKYTKRQLQADFINKKITEYKWKGYLKSFLKIEESNNELKEICTSFVRSLNDIISNCIEITLNMKNKNLDIFKENLYDNVTEISNIHNVAICQNRNEIGFKSNTFLPEYLKK